MDGIANAASVASGAISGVVNTVGGAMNETIQSAQEYLNKIKANPTGEGEAKDPGDTSSVKDIYEAMYIKINIFLHSMLTAQANAYAFSKTYKQYKMKYDPDATLLKEMIQEKVRMVLPDDFI